MSTYELAQFNIAVLRYERDVADLQGSCWFEQALEPTYVFCWIAAGHRPSFHEAHGALVRLRDEGPTAQAFTLQHSFPTPGST